MTDPGALLCYRLERAGGAQARDHLHPDVDAHRHAEEAAEEARRLRRGRLPQDYGRA